MWRAAQANSLTGNAARGNLQVGFLSFGTGNTFDHNVAVANVQDGFEILESSAATTTNTVTNNTASQNGLDGMQLFEGSHDLVQGNVANDNGRLGLFIQEDSADTIAGNTTDRNGSDGILLAGTTGSAVSATTTQSNLGDGIDVDGAVVGQHDQRQHGDRQRPGRGRFRPVRRLGDDHAEYVDEQQGQYAQSRRACVAMGEVASLWG